MTEIQRAETREIVHPGTGEVVDVTTLPDEELAEVWVEMEDRERRSKAWREHVTNELRDRLTAKNRKVWPVGAYEVSREDRNESVWEPRELDAVIRELVQNGVVTAVEVADVVSHEPTVSKSNANRFLARLAGDARRAVDECRTWTRKPGPVKVVRAVQLIEESEQE